MVVFCGPPPVFRVGHPSLLPLARCACGLLRLAARRLRLRGLSFPASSAAAAPDCATCLRAVSTPAFSASLLITLASLFPTARGPFIASHVHAVPRRRSSCSLSCQPPALVSASSSLSRTSLSCCLMAAEACTGRGPHVSVPPSQRIRYSLPPLFSSREDSTAVMVGSAGRAVAGSR